MYKITKDDQHEEKFRLSYHLPNNLLDPLYTIENLVWEDTERFIKNIVKDQDDLRWIHDLINLLDRQVNLKDTGDWSVL